MPITKNPFAQFATTGNPNGLNLPFGFFTGLVTSFDKTNLDMENPKPHGGLPYNESRDPTEYPSTTTHTTPTRGYYAAPAQPPTKFTQPYNPKRTYLDFIKDYI